MLAFFMPEWWPFSNRNGGPFRPEYANGRELLTHAGKISHQMALEKSTLEYDKYRQTQKQIQHEENLKELEQDIQRIIPPGKSDAGDE